jgi:phage FluMu protein Com
MPISITCAGCEKKLKVPDTAAGKKIRCPACKSLVEVPDEEVEWAEPDEEVAVTKAVPPPLPKQMREADPPSRKKKRRGDEDDQYEMEEEDEEPDEERPRRKKKRRFSDDYDRPRRKLAPHRGVKILIWGIVSVVISCAPIFSWALAAWVYGMANEDLGSMNSRRMDPSGRGLVYAGKICAIVGSVLAMIWLVVAVYLRIKER